MRRRVRCNLHIYDDVTRVNVTSDYFTAIALYCLLFHEKLLTNSHKTKSLFDSIFNTWHRLDLPLKSFDLDHDDGNGNISRMLHIQFKLAHFLTIFDNI